MISLRPRLRRKVSQLIGPESELQRLPLYDLEVDLNVRAGAFQLQETLWFTNTFPIALDEIVLRIYANVPAARKKDRPRVVGLSRARCLDGRTCRFVADDASTLRVKPARPLPPGGRIRMQMVFTGRLSRIDPSRTNVLTQGLESMTTMLSPHSAGDYGLLAKGDDIASLANFFAVLARRENGRWAALERSPLGDLGSDDLFHVRAVVTTEKDVQVVTAGVPIGKPRRGTDGRYQLRVAAALVRDFAILASADYTSRTRTVNGVPVRSFYRSDDRQAGVRVLSAAAEALRVFERRFGDYPYAELDVAEAPLVGGAGGVEFSGLVTVASMLYRPIDIRTGPFAALAQSGGKESPLQDLFDAMLEFVTAHEVAHQYWHTLVGSDSRRNPFDDEGLAQFSAILYVESRYGPERAKLETDRQVAMGFHTMRMMGQSDGPVYRPVDAFPNALAYGGLIYGKGPLVYRELRRAAGDAVFFATLREYVLKYRFRTAPGRAFIDMLLGKIPALTPIARRWLDQTRGDQDLGVMNIAEMMTRMTGRDLLSLVPKSDEPVKKLEDMNESEMTELLQNLQQLSKSMENDPNSLDPEQLRQLMQLLNMEKQQ
jgi:hypothetical protein